MLEVTRKRFKSAKTALRAWNDNLPFKTLDGRRISKSDLPEKTKVRIHFSRGFIEI